MDWTSTLCAILVASSFGHAEKSTNSFLGEYENRIENILGLSDTSFTGIHSTSSPITPEINEEEYDFIIVGAGSAGSVIANRLSEIGSWKILLLEAGLPENEFAQHPTLAPLLQFTDYNWGYRTEPQKHICLAMEEQRCRWPRGKALGGSSVINYMIYSRGNPQDYDMWAGLGNPGWSYNEVLPYFLKSEDSHIRNATINPLYHNTGGYLSVGDPYSSEIANAFIQAGVELGYKENDFNTPEQIGFSKPQATIRLGRRHSTASAFLYPILHRENLRILTGVRVTKILIDPSTNKAYGVTYNQAGNQISAKATKEVILSAGTINSPQLLMLSGVGPREHLEEVGIITLSDLPVGKTLYDHPTFYGLVLNTNLTMNSMADLFDPEQLERWYTKGEGPLAQIGGTEGLAFINTNVASPNQNYPDIELFLIDAALPGDFGRLTRRTIRVSDEYYREMYAPLEGIPSFSIYIVLLHPKSSGCVKLRSSNPYDYPLLYANYLSDPENSDVATLTAGIRFVMRLTETEAYKKYNIQLNTKPFVGCEHLPYNSDIYWHCALQLLTTTVHHQIATCKMGPIEDLTAVVNNELRVYGIGNLRVADASIIPIPLSAHTNAPTIMVGEMASDLIKKDWGVL